MAKQKKDPSEKLGLGNLLVWNSRQISTSVYVLMAGFLMATYATSAKGWSLLVGCFAIAMGAIGILRFIFVKEKYDVDAEKTEESLKISDAVAVIKGNKYILILAFMGLLFNFVTNMGTQVYYYTWIVGNVGLMSIASAVQIIAIPLAFVFPPLLKKITAVKLMFAGFIVSAIGYGLNFVAGANVPLLAVAAVLTGAGTVPGSMLIALPILECSDCIEWKEPCPALSALGRKSVRLSEAPGLASCLPQWDTMETFPFSRTEHFSASAFRSA